MAHRRFYRNIILAVVLGILVAVAALVLSGVSLGNTAGSSSSSSSAASAAGNNKNTCPAGYTYAPGVAAPKTCKTRANLVTNPCATMVNGTCVSSGIAGAGLSCVHENRWNISSALAPSPIHNAAQCSSAAPLVTPPVVMVTVTKLSSGSDSLRASVNILLKNTGNCAARLASLVFLLEQTNNLPLSYPTSYGNNGDKVRLWAAAGIENAVLTALCPHPAQPAAPTCLVTSTGSVPCGAAVAYAPNSVSPALNLDLNTIAAGGNVTFNLSVAFSLSAADLALLRLLPTTLLRVKLLATYDTCCDRDNACGIDLDCDGQLNGARTEYAASPNLAVPASCAEQCDCVSFSDALGGTWLTPTSNCSTQPAYPTAPASVASVCASAVYSSATVGTTPCCSAGASVYGCNGANYSLTHAACIAPALGQNCIGDFGSGALIAAPCAPVAELDMDCACLPYGLEVYDTGAACLFPIARSDGCGGTQVYSRACSPSYANTVCQADNTCVCNPYNVSLYDNGTTDCFYPQFLDNGCGGNQSYSRACSPAYTNTVCQANNSCTCTPYDLAHYDVNPLAQCFYGQTLDNGCGSTSLYARECANAFDTCNPDNTCSCSPYNLTYYDNGTSPCFHLQELDNGCNATQNYSRACSPSYANTVCQPSNDTCTCERYDLAHYDNGTTDCFYAQVLDDGCGGTANYSRDCAGPDAASYSCNPNNTCTCDFAVPTCSSDPRECGPDFNLTNPCNASAPVECHKECSALTACNLTTNTCYVPLPVPPPAGVFCTYKPDDFNTSLAGTCVLGNFSAPNASLPATNICYRRRNVGADPQCVVDLCGPGVYNPTPYTMGVGTLNNPFATNARHSYIYGSPVLEAQAYLLRRVYTENYLLLPPYFFNDTQSFGASAPTVADPAGRLLAEVNVARINMRIEQINDATVSPSGAVSAFAAMTYSTNASCAAAVGEAAGLNLVNTVFFADCALGMRYFNASLASTFPTSNSTFSFVNSFCRTRCQPGLPGSVPTNPACLHYMSTFLLENSFVYNNVTIWQSLSDALDLYNREFDNCGGPATSCLVVPYGIL